MYASACFQYTALNEGLTAHNTLSTAKPNYPPLPLPLQLPQPQPMPLALPLPLQLPLQLTLQLPLPLPMPLPILLEIHNIVLLDGWKDLPTTAVFEHS